MAKPKKIVDFSEPRGEGDNSDEALKDYVTRFAAHVAKVEELRGEGKEILSEAKDAGFSKMAIRKAVKILRMTEEQDQVRKEVDQQVRHITELCGDLPLFSASA